MFMTYGTKNRAECYFGTPYHAKALELEAKQSDLQAKESDLAPLKFTMAGVEDPDKKKREQYNKECRKIDADWLRLQADMLRWKAQKCRKEDPAQKSNPFQEAEDIMKGHRIFRDDDEDDFHCFYDTPYQAKAYELRGKMYDLRSRMNKLTPVNYDHGIVMDPDKSKRDRIDRDLDSVRAEILDLKSKVMKWKAAKVREMDKTQKSVSKGGEGSRGGKIMGHTSSGKPIYGSKQDMRTYSSWSGQDHKDAHKLLTDEADKKNKMALDHQRTAERTDISPHAAKIWAKNAQEHADTGDAHREAAKYHFASSRVISDISRKEAKKGGFFTLVCGQQRLLSKARPKVDYWVTANGAHIPMSGTRGEGTPLAGSDSLKEHLGKKTKKKDGGGEKEKQARKDPTDGLKHLQGIGKVPAVAYGKVQAGDVLIYNFGTRNKVVEAETRGNWVHMKVEGSDGKVHEMKKKASTTIGFDKKASGVSGNTGQKESAAKDKPAVNKKTEKQYTHKQKLGRVFKQIPDQNKGGSKRNGTRSVMLTGSMAEALGKPQYHTMKESEMTEEHVNKLHDLFYKMSIEVITMGTYFEWSNLTNKKGSLQKGFTTVVKGTMKNPKGTGVDVDTGMMPQRDVDVPELQVPAPEVVNPDQPVTRKAAKCGAKGDLMPGVEDLSKPVPEGKEISHYMTKFKEGTPMSSTGKPPESREQAIAIGMSEARKSQKAVCKSLPFHIR